MYSRFGWLLIILRAAFYAGVIAFFVLAAGSPNETVRGVAGGIIMADIITWFGRSLIKLDKYLAEFAWDAVLNIIVVIVLVYVYGISFPTEGEGMAIGFMAFLAASGIKIFWYAAQELSENG